MLWSLLLINTVTGQVKKLLKVHFTTNAEKTLDAWLSCILEDEGLGCRKPAKGAYQ